MHPLEDEIVDIPPNRVKFFGTTGKMLLPGRASVEAVLSKLPQDRLITTGHLRQTLTEQFEVEGTCPITTKKALLAIAQDNKKQSVPTWRVINQNGGLISGFPGGVDRQADLLQQDGFALETTGKAPKVKDFKAVLRSGFSFLEDELCSF